MPIYGLVITLSDAELSTQQSERVLPALASAFGTDAITEVATWGRYQRVASHAHDRGSDDARGGGGRDTDGAGSARRRGHPSGTGGRVLVAIEGSFSSSRARLSDGSAHPLVIRLLLTHGNIRLAHPPLPVPSGGGRERSRAGRRTLRAHRQIPVSQNPDVSPGAPAPTVETSLHGGRPSTGPMTIPCVLHGCRRGRC